MFFSLILCHCLAFLPETSIDLEGLPLQIEWVDLNQDGALDLTAAVMKTETIGAFSTFYQDGSLRGLYEDTTSQTFFLRTWLNSESGFVETASLDLEEGFISFILKGGKLYLWNSQNRLDIMKFAHGGWQLTHSITPPISNMVSGNEFYFLWSVHGRQYWMLPGLSDLTLYDCDHQKTSMIPYFDTMISNGQSGSNGQSLSLPLPIAMDVTGDGQDDLVFSKGDQRWIWHAVEPLPATEEPLVLRYFPINLPGILIDLDGDKKHELLSIEIQDEDIEKLKDLKKIKSQLQVFRADHPLEFEDTPAHEQTIPGFLIPEGDDEFFLSSPFQDINSDGLLDLASFGFKVSYLQVARIATTGKMNITFLLELHLQGLNGKFKTLPGGPFEMSWRLNLRKLRMPEFGQLTADFNADGWMDLMTVSEKKVSIHTLSESGYGSSKGHMVRFPVEFRDPDQVFGRDLNADNQAEIILLKIVGRTGRLSILEAGL